MVLLKHSTVSRTNPLAPRPDSVLPALKPIWLKGGERVLIDSNLLSATETCCRLLQRREWPWLATSPPPGKIYLLRDVRHHEILVFRRCLLIDCKKKRRKEKKKKEEKKEKKEREKREREADEVLLV